MPGSISQRDVIRVHIALIESSDGAHLHPIQVISVIYPFQIHIVAQFLCDDLCFGYDLFDQDLTGRLILPPFPPNIPIC